MITNAPKALCFAFLDIAPEANLLREDAVRECVYFLPFDQPVTHVDGKSVQTCWNHTFKLTDINVAKPSETRDGTIRSGSFSLVYDPEVMSKSQAIDALTNAFFEHSSNSLTQKGD